MPALMSYTNVRLITSTSPEAVDTFICCATSGVGYHTRPNKSIFMPIQRGHDDFAVQQSCPEIIPGEFYFYDAHAMHCYLSSDEYMLWIEMLAMAVGYEQLSIDIPEVGLVNSHLFGATARLNDDLPMMALIAYCSHYPCFHGAGLKALLEQLLKIDQRIRQGDLRIAYDSWWHKKLISHIDACERATKTNGLVLLGR